MQDKVYSSVTFIPFSKFNMKTKVVSFAALKIKYYVLKIKMNWQLFNKKSLK